MFSKPTLTTPGRSVGCTAQEDARTKKPRQSGAEFPRGVAGCRECKESNPHRNTTTETVAHRPKQTVTQIGCKPTRQGFCAAIWSAIWAGSVSRTEGANGKRPIKVRRIALRDGRYSGLGNIWERTGRSLRRFQPPNPRPSRSTRATNTIGNHIEDAHDGPSLPLPETRGAPPAPAIDVRAVEHWAVNEEGPSDLAL